jgi:cell division protein FtsQ
MIAEGLLDPVGRRRIPRPGRRFLLALVLIVAVLAGGWLWLRDSSLVAVKRVTVTGASGPDADEIRAALISAAHNMTTLDVKLGQLNTAVEPYPDVKALQVSTQFPHGMRIHVVEQVPVAAVMIGNKSVAVSGDGTLLQDSAPSGPLPLIPLRAAPGGTRLTDPSALAAVALLAAAPYQLLPKISQVTETSAHGLVAQLRDGPAIYFGDSQRLDAKWLAAAEVLVDSRSPGAVYIDVSDPERPAAGAGAPPPSTAAGSTSTSAAGTSSTTATSPTGG